MIATLLLAQLAATWALVGLVWLVQVVQYPLFNDVGRTKFRRFHERYTRRIAWVVGPLMAIELGSAVVLVVVAPVLAPAWLQWTGLSLLVVIWLSTMFLQVPSHHTLSNGFSDDHHRRLVRTNWLRTVAWTSRGFLLLLVLERQLA